MYNDCLISMVILIILNNVHGCVIRSIFVFSLFVTNIVFMYHFVLVFVYNLVLLSVIYMLYFSSVRSFNVFMLYLFTLRFAPDLFNYQGVLFTAIYIEKNQYWWIFEFYFHVFILPDT
jgi:hypothetical protein